jgi:hypothetical protein
LQDIQLFLCGTEIATLQKKAERERAQVPMMWPNISRAIKSNIRVARGAGPLDDFVTAATGFSGGRNG